MTSIPKLPTIVGHAGFQDHRFFGYGALGDLLGKAGLAEIAWLSMTGTLPTPEQLQVLGNCAAVAAVADPHSWPFKIARLAASYGLASQGLATALAAGPGSFFDAYRFKRAAAILEALHARATVGNENALRDALAEVLRGGAEPFGVVYRRKDERLEGLRRFVQASGQEPGPYWRLADRTIDLARSEHGLEPHITFGVTAYALDAGLGVREIGLLGVLLLVPALFANAAEGADQRADVLCRLPAECVRYEGPVPRASPRAAKERA
jgi:hypothetical protein